MRDDMAGLEMPGAIHRRGEPVTSRMIVTAASAAFGSSLVALLGSLNLNWPDHPPIRVYDLGLERKTLETLSRHGVEVVPVPPFCPHWRKHFTWKIWCWNDAPARMSLAGASFQHQIFHVKCFRQWGQNGGTGTTSTPCRERVSNVLRSSPRS